MKTEDQEGTREFLEFEVVPPKAGESLFRTWWARLARTLRDNDFINNEIELAAQHVSNLAPKHAHKSLLGNDETMARIEAERYKAAKELADTELVQAEAMRVRVEAAKTQAEAELLREEAQGLKQKRILELLKASKELMEAGYKISISDDEIPALIISRRNASKPKLKRLDGDDDAKTNS